MMLVLYSLCPKILINGGWWSSNPIRGARATRFPSPGNYMYSKWFLSFSNSITPPSWYPPTNFLVICWYHQCQLFYTLSDINASSRIPMIGCMVVYSANLICCFIRYSPSCSRTVTNITTYVSGYDHIPIALSNPALLPEIFCANSWWIFLRNPLIFSITTTYLVHKIALTVLK